MVYLSKSPKETEKLAGFFIAKILKKNLPAGKKNAVIIALEGELGAGKTVFVRGVVKALKIKAKIKSPTFNLIKKYPLSSDTRYKIHDTRYFYHLDCYRLRDYRDLKVLGIKEILDNPENIIFIEWSDRVKKILPKNHIRIHIDHVNANTRKIRIEFRT